MKKIIFLGLMAQALLSTSSHAKIKCDMYLGLEPIADESVYESCVFDYKMKLMGVDTTVSSCTLAEPGDRGLFYEMSRTVIFGEDAIAVKKGDSNTSGYLPGVRMVYSIQKSHFLSKRESVDHEGTTRIECIEIKE